MLAILAAARPAQPSCRKSQGNGAGCEGHLARSLSVTYGQCGFGELAWRSLGICGESTVHIECDSLLQSMST